MLAALTCILLSAADPLESLVDLDASLDGQPPPARESLPLRSALAQIPGLWARADYSSAADLLRRATTEPLLDPVAKLLEAESLAYAGDLAGSASRFSDLLDSKDAAVAASASGRLAEVQLEQGHFAEAAERLRFESRAMDGAVLELDLARALVGAGDDAAARDALRRSYLFDPEGEVGAEAQQLLVQLQSPLTGLPGREVLGHAQRFLHTGRAAEALAAMNAYAGAERSGELQVCAAQCERALGHQDAAREHLQRATVLGDSRAAAVARIQLARAMEADGDVPSALAMLSRVARERPRSPEGSEALYLAAWIAMEHGDSAQGFRWFAQLTARRRDRHAAEARWWTGWARELSGEPAVAIAAWKPLTGSTAGLGPQALYWSARAEDERGNTTSAAALRRRLNQSAPASYYALLDRQGLTAESQSRRLDACSDSLDPESALGLSLRRGEILWALGLAEPARAELDEARHQVAGAAQAVAVADVEAALGEPGRAFALVQARGGGCFSGGVLAPEFFPRPYRAEVEEAAGTTGVDPIWIWSIMRQESRFNARARSASLAGGAMQLLQSTASRIAAIAGIPEADRESPAQAIAVAAWYLRALSDRFHGDLAMVAAAYNAGPEAVAGWLSAQSGRRLDVFVEQIPYRETRGYVKAVLANASAYRSLFGPSGSLVEPSLPVLPADPGVAF